MTKTELRKLRGLKQVEMAKLLGVSYTTYNFWENGKTSLSIEKVEKIANILGVKIVRLFVEV